MRQKGFKYQSGFALIELIVVIALIAILASIAMPRYATHLKKAQSVSCLTNRRLIETEEIAKLVIHSSDEGRPELRAQHTDPSQSALSVPERILTFLLWNPGTAFAAESYDALPLISSKYTCPSGGIYLWLISDPEDKYYPRVGCSQHFGQIPQEVAEEKTGLDMIAGLVGGFTMDADSGNSVNFGEFAADVHGAEWVEGKSGSALQFDGKNDYVKADIEDWAGPFTVMAWVKADQVKHDQYDSIFASGDKPQKNNFQIDSDGKGNYRFYSQGNSKLNIGSISADWQLVSVSFDGANVSTYNNGQLVETGKWNGSGEFTHYKIGLNRNSNKKFTGAIDELGVYNRTVTAEEIQTYYEKTK